MKPEMNPLTDRERRLTDSVARQNARIQELWESSEALKAECKAYQEQIVELRGTIERLEADAETACKTMQELRGDKVRADMFRVLEEYVHDDVDVTDIGKAVVSYHDLLVWGACHGGD